MTRNNSHFRRRGTFSGIGPTFKCIACGKLTRDTGHDEASVQLCKKCLDESYMENAHYDGNHDEKPDPDCKYCNPPSTNSGEQQ